MPDDRHDAVAIPADGAEQQRIAALLRGVDEPASAALRRRVDGLVAARGGAGRVRRPIVLAGSALATAAVVVALALGGGGSPATPSAPDAARLAALAPTSGPPAVDAANPALLQRSVGALRFPSWRSWGWRVTGSRSDVRGGRRLETVVYADTKGRSVAYLIASGAPLADTTGDHGTSYRSFEQDGVRVVTWEQGGHTCVLASAEVPASELERIVSARS